MAATPAGAVAQAPSGDGVLFVRVGGARVVLPLDRVALVTRRLSMRRWDGLPAGIAGVTQLRGEPTPVVDLGVLLGGAPAASDGRLLALRAGARPLALAVDAVLGLGSLPESERRALPPLLRPDAGPVAALAAADDGLLLVLDAARLLPEERWAALDLKAVPR